MKIRLTKKRQAILNFLKENQGSFTAKDIHTALPDIDLVTIYRNLDLFVKERLITQLRFGAETSYEYQTAPHHHAVCSDCEEVIHFSVNDKALKKLVAVSNFDTNTVEVTVRGNCAKHKK